MCAERIVAICTGLCIFEVVLRTAVQRVEGSTELPFFFRSNEKIVVAASEYFDRCFFQHQALVGWLVKKGSRTNRAGGRLS